LTKFGLPEIPEYVPPYYLDVKKTYPFVLQTGARKPLLYHGAHQNIPRFRTVFPSAQVEIHPATAASLDIHDKEHIRIISEIGSVEAEAQIVHEREILPNVLEMYHGWENSRVNFVTYDHRNDPISGFPLLKATPVRIEKIET
jgi:anaerobic selenocysteine-containing dehydrogenase